MHKEQAHPENDIEPHLARAFADTFIGRDDLYPIQRPDGGYVTLRHPLTQDQIIAHLQGLITLGAYALDATDHARWLCLDADDRAAWTRLFRFASALQRQAIPAYLELSRRGGHLWLFFDSRPGAEVRRFGQQLQAEYGLSGVELYPKQDTLRTGPGSLMRLPLGIHRKDGRRYPFITAEGRPLRPTIREQIAALAHPKRVPPESFAAVLARHPAKPAEPPIPFAEPRSQRRVRPDLASQDAPLSARLKACISVYDFVSQFVALNEQGIGVCPFHKDEHPSFGVNTAENYWHCWAGCGGGSLVGFWQKWRERQGEDASFTATLKDLADRLLPR